MKKFLRTTYSTTPGEMVAPYVAIGEPYSGCGDNGEGLIFECAPMASSNTALTPTLKNYSEFTTECEAATPLW